MAGRDRDRDAGADLDALARARSRGVVGGAEVEAGVAVVGARRQRRAGGAGARLAAITRAAPAAKRAKRAALGGRQQRPHAHALGGVLALELAGELVQLGEARALRVGEEQLDRLRAGA